VSTPRWREYDCYSDKIPPTINLKLVTCQDNNETWGKARLYTSTVLLSNVLDFSPTILSFVALTPSCQWPALTCNVPVNYLFVMPQENLACGGNIHSELVMELPWKTMLLQMLHWWHQLQWQPMRKQVPAKFVQIWDDWCASCLVE